MKVIKKILILFILIFTLFTINIISHAEIVKYQDWKTGEMITYDVYTFEDLYSVFEDLCNEHDECIEALHENIDDFDESISYNEYKNEEYLSQIRDLEDELDNKEEEISDLHTKISNNSKIHLEYILGVLIIFVIPGLICIYFDKKNNKPAVTHTTDIDKLDNIFQNKNKYEYITNLLIQNLPDNPKNIVDVINILYTFYQSQEITFPKDINISNLNSLSTFEQYYLLENILKIGIGLNDLDEIVNSLENFYKNQ